MRFVTVVPPFDIRMNFWANNYQIAMINPFKKLYNRDKSKDKEISSKEMWCLWLWSDTSSENKMRRLDEATKKDAILTYYPEFDFSDEVIIECMELYDGFLLTPAGRAFKEEEESLLKRAKFIKETEYTFDSIAKDNKGAVVYVAGKPLTIKGTAKDLDSMRANTLKLYQQYDEVRKMFIEEESNLRIWGGGTESLLDSAGLIEFDDD
jgi:hypothetical protein